MKKKLIILALKINHLFMRLLVSILNSFKNLCNFLILRVAEE